MRRRRPDYSMLYLVLLVVVALTLVYIVCRPMTRSATAEVTDPPNIVTPQSEPIPMTTENPKLELLLRLQVSQELSDPLSEPIEVLQEDIELLVRVLTCEEWDDYEFGKRGVCAVILNRGIRQT